MRFSLDIRNDGSAFWPALSMWPMRAVHGTAAVQEFNCADTQRLASEIAPDASRLEAIENDSDDAHAREV